MASILISERKIVWFELSPVLREFPEQHAGGVVAWAEANRDFLDGVQQHRHQPEPPSRLAA
jgi:hypothetical protein